MPNAKFTPYSGMFICIKPVNSNTTGTITPMFSSNDWMKPNLKQKAGTARGKCGKMACSKGLGKVTKSDVFERKYA